MCISIKNRVLTFFKNFHGNWTFLLFVLFTYYVQGQSYEMSLNRKVINTKGCKEIVYVTDKTPKARGKRFYYWYKSQEVHHSQNNYSGELLNGPYVKYYPNNQLIVKGDFKKGLKSGIWTSWHVNGLVSEVAKWKKGRKTGKYVKRDSTGTIVNYGSYKKGLKSGKWISPVTNDTLFYKKGKLIVVDSMAQDSLSRPSFFKRLFKKEETRKKQEPEISQSEKQGFFRRLFTKKDKNTANQSQKKKPNERKLKKDRKSTTKTDKKKEGFLKRLFRKKEKKQTKKDA
jgi:hypothetical protein